MSLVALPVSPLTTTTAASFTGNDYLYDFAIGGLPFLSAIGHSISPYSVAEYIRQTAPYRKEQFDSSRDPGEQSLVYWWLKSQSSFHGGAGQDYLDTALNNDPLQPIRFSSSLGVDTWTPGKVTLLKQAVVNRASTAASQRLMGAVDGTTPVYFLAADAALTRETGAASAAVTWGGTGTITSLCNDGSSYYAADAVGIWKGTLAGGAGTKVWNTGNANVVLGWVKQRLMAGIGPAIYELVGGAPPTLPAAKYTHPNPNWIWTSIVEGPNAIYAAGYAGSTSSIYKFTLASDGSVPTLASAVSVAEMPPGEQVHSLFPYLGSLLGIGTSKGLRVAVFDSASGNFTYGPRVFETTSPVRCMVGDDRFLYAGVTNGLGGSSGLYRIDLGTEVSFGRYAYAADLQAKVTGSVTGLSLLGAQLVFCVAGQGAYLQSSTLLEPSGTLTTSKIRFGTVEPKLLKYVRLRSAPLAGSLAVSYTPPSGAPVPLATYTLAGSNDLAESAINSIPLEYASLTFTLTPDAGNLTGPELRSYQLKALPAAKRQRQEVVPLLCFDIERDRGGQTMGSLGSALTRLQALEAMEEAGDAVTFQHFTSDNPTVSRVVVIDELRFAQRDAPTNCGGWGGVILATVRSVD